MDLVFISEPVCFFLGNLLILEIYKKQKWHNILFFPSSVIEFMSLVIFADCFVSALLFTVTRAPRYFGILQDHRGQPLSVEVSEEYMDQDYIATNRYYTRTNVT